MCIAPIVAPFAVIMSAGIVIAVRIVAFDITEIEKNLVIGQAIIAYKSVVTIKLVS